MIALLVFVVVFVVAMATLYYMGEDAKDQTIGRDAFRPERAAVIHEIQRDQQARFTQRRTR